MSSSSLDARLISSPLAALSMVATSSLEGRDLYFLTGEHGMGGTASAPVSHAGSGPPSPSSGPMHMDDLGYYQHRKRKCTASDVSNAAPEHFWSPKTRSPLVPHTSSIHDELADRLPSVSQVTGADESWPNRHHAEDAYPSPRLPAILPAVAGERREGSLPPLQQQQQANGLASLLNPAETASTSAAAAAAAARIASATSSPPPPIAPNTGFTARQRPELHNPSATRRAFGGPLDYSRLSSSPTPSSPGHDSNYGGNESPRYVSGSVDGGSRPATPTPSTQHLTPDERKRRRLERNRLAARECRQKKKLYVQELEDRMDRMEGENQRLRKEIKELNAKLTLGSMHLDRRGISEERMANAPPLAPPTADPSGPFSHGMSTGTGGSGGGGVDSSAPTPPPSSGNAFALHHHHQALSQHHTGMELPPRSTASPILPAPVASMTHGRPHSNSWSPI